MEELGSVNEISSQLIYDKDGKNRFFLRVISHQSKQGGTEYKFGISEFWLCASSHRWLPSKKHHVYLPLSAWATLVSHANLITSVLETLPIVKPAAPKPFQPVRQQSSTSSESTKPTENDGPPKRQSGRPPKRAHEHNVAAGSDDRGTRGTTPLAPVEEATHDKQVKLGNEGKSHDSDRAGEGGQLASDTSDTGFDEACGSAEPTR